MLIGTGVRSYEAGEVWHLLDQRVGMPITKIPLRNFDNISMDKYNVMVIVSGSYKLSDNQVKKIKSWVDKGNTIISIGSGSKLLIDKKIVSEELVKNEKYFVKSLQQSTLTPWYLVLMLSLILLFLSWYRETK